jgi:photosystem II PsbU protein
MRNAADNKLSIDFGNKINLNDTHVRAFIPYKGLYPHPAQAIVKNAPYQKPEDVLSLPGITAEQRSILQSHLDKFYVPSESLPGEADFV